MPETAHCPLAEPTNVETQLAQLEVTESFASRVLRWLTGDWWLLESKGGLYGVWHPWKRHRWENYVFTREEAVQEQTRRNSGRPYSICSACGTTYASHHAGRRGGVRCPGTEN